MTMNKFENQSYYPVFEELVKAESGTYNIVYDSVWGTRKIGDVQLTMDHKLIFNVESQFSIPALLLCLETGSARLIKKEKDTSYMYFCINDTFDNLYLKVAKEGVNPDLDKQRKDMGNYFPREDYDSLSLETNFMKHLANNLPNLLATFPYRK